MTNNVTFTLMCPYYVFVSVYAFNCSYPQSYLSYLKLLLSRMKVFLRILTGKKNISVINPIFTRHKLISNIPNGKHFQISIM